MRFQTLFSVSLFLSSLFAQSLAFGIEFLQEADLADPNSTPQKSSASLSPYPTLPSNTEAQNRSLALRNYAYYIDPQKIIPRQALFRALNFFEYYKSMIRNQRYLSVVDFTKHSSEKRFYLIDLQSGFVEAYHTAHGKGSDRDHDGYADTFSNVEDSLTSSIGFFLTASTYTGDAGFSLLLHGLSPTNNQAYDRDIILHGADYVEEGKSKMGRSHGCFALSRKVYKSVIEKIKGGSLIFAWVGDRKREKQYTRLMPSGR